MIGQADAKLAVQQVWENLSEEIKKRILVSYHDGHNEYFKASTAWIKNFRSETVAQRKFENVNKRFDSRFTFVRNGGLARSVLEHVFLKYNPSVNRLFFTDLLAAHETAPSATVISLVDKVITDLQSQRQDPTLALADLYFAALQWMNPEYFDGNLKWTEVVDRAKDAGVFTTNITCTSGQVIEVPVVFPQIEPSPSSTTVNAGDPDITTCAETISENQSKIQLCSTLLDHLYERLLQTDKAQAELRRLSKMILDVQCIGDLDRVFNTPPGLLGIMESKAQMMIHGAADMTQQLMSWQCQHEDSECQARLLLINTRAYTSIPLQSLGDHAAKVKSVSDSKQKTSTSLLHKIKDANLELTNVSCDLGITPTDIAMPDDATPVCSLRVIESEVSARLQAAQSAMNEKVRIERERILEDIRAFRANHRQLPTEYTTELDSIGEQVSNVKSLSQLSTLGDLVNRVNERASSDLQLLDMQGLAVEFDLKHDPTVLLLLASCLIQHSKLIPALRLVQWATTTICPNLAPCGTEAVSRLLLQALVCGIRDRVNITSLILDIPALQSTILHHVSDPVLRERVAFSLVASAIHWSSTEFASAFHHVYAESLQRFPEWANACSLFAHGKLPAFLTESEEVSLASVRSDLHELVRREKGLFVHLQCRNAKHFAHFENESVLPTLFAILLDIEEYLSKGQHDQALKQLGEFDPSRIYNNLTKTFRLPIQDHAHYTKLILVAISEFLALCKRYVKESSRIRKGGFLSPTSLRAELRAWETERGLDKSPDDIIAVLLRPLTDVPPTVQNVADTRILFPETLGPSHSFADHFPSLRKLYFEIPHPMPQDSLAALLDDIRNAPPHVQKSCDMANSAIDSSTSTGPSEGTEDRDNLILRRPVIQLRASEDLELFDFLIATCRYGAAAGIVNRAIGLDEDHARQTKQSERQEASALLCMLAVAKDAAERANASSAWREDAYRLCEGIERLIRAKRSGGLASDMSALVDSVTALQFAVNNPDFGFVEVNRTLTGLDRERDVNEEPLPFSPIREQAADLYRDWQSLCVAPSTDRNKAWRSFCKSLAEYCGLYHELFETLTVRKDKDTYAYPFPVLQTAFKRPRCQYLNRPILLHFYAADTVRQPQLQDLLNEVSSDDSMCPHHLVFCCSKESDIRSNLGGRLKHVGFFTDDIENLCRSIKPDALMRTRLYLSADSLSACSPFSSEGYVHKDNGLFVGRRNILRELETNPHVALWGGRKVGKTSLLHAYAQGLKAEGFEVAYVYADTHDDSTDPDLALAARICRTLGFPPPGSLSDFERSLQDARLAGRRLAFLVDEVDEYIKASRQCHEARFPFASKLRQACMEDTSGSTRLVYAGYHQLYSEAHPKDARRVAHPFVNIAKEIRLGDLNSSEVRELVVGGFDELLGVKCCPDAPRLIWSYASGHPAFIQQFCSLLVDLVDAKRRRCGALEVTAGDIDRIYKQNEPDDIIRKPFICFVEEVLGWNLTCLGRAVVIIFADRLRELRLRDESELQTQDLIAHICNWSNLSGVNPPSEDHVRLTLELLQMTNILRLRGETLSGDVSFRFPVYVDILSRLGQLEQPQSDIERLLMEYDRVEREKGVLR